ncbi:ExbD/TolR family protein [Salinisphaera japonica]|uniref:Biopolymer transporter ExbD n=1 Tax=Salinisphaera japonica YTM-1 TaxID=1209778 RepID=A0A423PRB8_9GAMM|nr:biopolymer transporter ExbD [Salinisphaera japonica]ROO28108.1 biopolymer transporter ExbD [Salinisphaera japonica YTM-1]
MRSRYTSEAQDDNTIDMTPMLDVVFILLIFFIVTTSFVKETGVDVTRPSAETAEPKKQANILIGIRENDEVWIDKQQVQPNAIRANVERLLAENPDSSVVVVADEGARTGVLVKALDQARLAGADNVSIAADRGNN